MFKRPDFKVGDMLLSSTFKYCDIIIDVFPEYLYVKDLSGNRSKPAIYRQTEISGYIGTGEYEYYSVKKHKD